MLKKTKAIFFLAQWAKLLLALGKAESILFLKHSSGENFQSLQVSALLSYSCNIYYCNINKDSGYRLQLDFYGPARTV